MTPIIPDNICKLYIVEFGSTASRKLVGCTTGDSINFNTEVVEVTGPTAEFVEVLPTYKSGTISSDTVLIMADGGDAQYASTVLMEWDKSKQKLAFAFEWVEGSSTKTIYGAAYITSLSINAPAQDFASVQLSLNITGEWQLDF